MIFNRMCCLHITHKLNFETTNYCLYSYECYDYEKYYKLKMCIICLKIKIFYALNIQTLKYNKYNRYYFTFKPDNKSILNFL